MSYFVTYELMEADVGPICEKMAHITVDPQRGDVLAQIKAELAKFHTQPVFVLTYEDETDDGYLIAADIDWCI
jgi:hypothetical protein